MRRQTKGLEILLARRQQRTAHTFVLQTQHDDDVTAFDTFFQGIENTHAHLGQIIGHQGFRAYYPHLGTTQSGQRVDVRARYA